MYQRDGLPEITDIPEPIASGDELAINVKAVAIKHFDKSRASGKHYSSGTPKTRGRVIGGDGVGLLPDGTRVYGMAVDGMLSEKALIDKDRVVKIPDGLDDATAAALPNAVIGAAMGLKFKAQIQPGDVVLINGATGFTGRVAVQVAKLYGAKKVIVAGRDAQSLEELRTLGADQTISLLQNDDELLNALQTAHKETPFDIIIDYLWGHSAELIFRCIKGDGAFSNRIRYVSVGSVTGDLVQLSAACLRSVDLQLTGSGLGAWSKQQVKQLFSEIITEMFAFAASGKLKVETFCMPLQDINRLWDIEVPKGKRLVITL